MDIATLIASVVTFLLGIGGTLAVVSKYTMPLKEVAEFLTSVVNALQDGKITKEEIEKIAKEAKDIPQAIRKLKK